METYKTLPVVDIVYKNLLDGVRVPIERVCRGAPIEHKHIQEKHKGFDVPLLSGQSSPYLFPSAIN